MRFHHAVFSAILTIAVASAAPRITGFAADRDTVPRYARIEIRVDLAGSYANPDDPDLIGISGEFTSPSGKRWDIPGFHSDGGFKVRFAADEIGAWTYAVRAREGAADTLSAKKAFMVAPSANHGWVRTAANKRYFRHDDGTAYHALGLGYPWNVKESVLDSLKAAGGNTIVYWNSTFDWEGGGGGRHLIESADSGLGRYDDRKGARVDQILSWCEARGMTMIFCIWPHPFLGDEINPGNKPGGWEAFYGDNPYKNLVKARDFFDDPRAWEYQRKLYRYLVARWGYSPALEHWWTVVETPGTDAWALRGPAVVEAWSRKVQDWFHANDPYGHPVSGSQQGNEDNYWAEGYRIFDIANREIYFNGSSHLSVVQETGKLWSQFKKPIVIGEIGNYKSPKTFHHAMWSALASGAASAPFWWNYPDQWSPENWAYMTAYSSFVKDIPFADLVEPQRLTPTVSGASAWAIVSDRMAFGWLINDGGKVAGKSLTLSGLPDGAWKAVWFDTWKGTALGAASPVTVQAGKLVIQAPAGDAADLAFKAWPANAVAVLPARIGNSFPEARVASRPGSIRISSGDGAPFSAALFATDGRRIAAGVSNASGLLDLRRSRGLGWLRLEREGIARWQAVAP